MTPTALLMCLVVGVSDGDTLTARCQQNNAYEQVKIRLAGIDAPEKKQPFGQRAKQALSTLCYMQEAKVTTHNKDRYKRLVADVQCQQGSDAGQHMVSSGMAWVYDRYASKHKHLYQYQATAQSNKLGLWVDLGTQSPPVAPWDWRRKK